MATDELSSKLSRRLQIEEGVEVPVAIDEADQGHENGAAEEKAATANADSELGAKLMRRGELNEGVGEHQQPSMKVFNPYTEFKEFSRKQIKDMERMFKEYDAGKDGYIDLMELKLMMEKLGAPQTHLGLKNMIKEVDEDLDNKLSFREFLLIFRKAAAGELAEDSGLSVLARLSEIDVSTEGVKGAKTFFEAKPLSMQAVSLRQRSGRSRRRRRGRQRRKSRGKLPSKTSSLPSNDHLIFLLLHHCPGFFSIPLSFI
uniref:EF-hand domain-containing protein n=1 Tax=Esox lucius TaxID=8010 RepID=A0AAY5KR75_ESOLU